jgi:hypothetical protein
LQARYTQEFAAFALITSKALVNSRWNKVVNIASTKMMKKIFAVPRVPQSHGMEHVAERRRRPRHSGATQSTIPE